MRDRNGITLIEIIITIAIIGIISITILSTFNLGLKNIVRAGERTDTVLLIQNAIDNKIKDIGFTTEDVIIDSDVNLQNKNISVHFGTTGVTGQSIGDVIKVKNVQNEDALSIEVTTFVTY